MGVEDLDSTLFFITCWGFVSQFQEAKTMLTAEVQTEATREVPVSTEQHSSLPADTVVAGEGVNAEAVVDSIESLQKKLREMEEDKKEKEAQIAEMQE